MSWALGAALSAAGLYSSWTWDLPTGPAIVAAFGAAIALVALAFLVKRSSLASWAMGFAGAVSLAGLLLVAFPGIEQPWLDAAQGPFLTEGERETRRDSLESIERSSAELASLRALEQDVRWGTKEMDAEKQERLRQYLAGRSEILAGDQLVLKALAARARERQRYALGSPLFVLGAGAVAVLARRRQRVAAD